MKKIRAIVLTTLILLVLMLCSKFIIQMLINLPNRSLEEVREFQNGDEVIRRGVIYTFVDRAELLGENGIRVYDFNQNQSHYIFHHYYYFDMTDQTQTPINLNNVDYDTFRMMYNRRARNDFFSLWDLIYMEIQNEFSGQGAYDFEGGFIISGFTNQIRRNVEIPSTINGNRVLGVGYRAFAGSPIRSFTWNRNVSVGRILFIAPYAFDSSEQLRTIGLSRSESGLLLLSKSISNLERLTEIRGISTVINAGLYNLPRLHTISDFRFQGPRFVRSGLFLDFTFDYERSFIKQVPNLREIGAVSWERSEIRMVNLEGTLDGGMTRYEMFIFYSHVVRDNRLEYRRHLMIFNLMDT